MKITGSVSFSLHEQITEALHSLSLDGLGDDGGTDYELNDVTIDGDDIVIVGFAVDVSRVEGRNVSRQYVVDAITEQLPDSIELTAEVDAS